MSDSGFLLAAYSSVCCCVSGIRLVTTLVKAIVTNGARVQQG